MTDDETIDAEELREAEALARALERGTAEAALPDEALQTAALLRYSAGSGALVKEREDALLEEVLATAERVAARRAPKGESAFSLRWVLGLAGLAAAALVLLLVWPSAPVATALPAPPVELVQAQLARIDDPSADARFEAAMRGYRTSVYAALSERYGAAPVPRAERSAPPRPLAWRTP